MELLPRDLGPSEVSARRALARCRLNMLAATTASVAANAMNKGDVLRRARAGMQAAKQAPRCCQCPTRCSWATST